jgi:hypothetical protein
MVQVVVDVAVLVEAAALSFITCWSAMIWDPLWNQVILEILRF